MIVIMTPTGTSGIGRALDEELHGRGNQVIIAGRRQHRLDEITAARSSMHGVQLDVQDAAAVDAFAADVRERFSDLNVLVNNARICRSENLAAEIIDVSVK